MRNILRYSLMLGLALACLFPASLLAQQALNFDGLDDRVTLGSVPISGSQNRTVEAWIRTSFNGTQRVIFDMGTMPVGNRFTLNVLNGLLRIEIGGGGINSATSVADGQWHHVAATFNNSAATKYTLYLDGAVTGSGNITQAINTSTGSPCYVGARNDLINHFLGDIDEVRVWNYARTQAQIQADMSTSFCGPQTGLVLYYKFNEGLPGANNAGLNMQPDASGMGNNGTLTNFALSGSTSNWVQGTTIVPGIVQGGTITASECISYTSPSGNHVWTNSGTYPDTIPSVFGCDSAITVQLTILQPASSNLVAAACYTYTSPSGNHVWNSSGNYQDTLSNAAQNGCDSLINISLTINGTTSGSANLTGCVPYTSPSGNQTWFNSGIYFDTLMNQNGCDSFLTAIFNVTPTPVGDLYIDACDSFFWSDNGMMYFAPGTFEDSVLHVLPGGCDSLTILHLALDATPSVSISQSGQSLTVSSNGATTQWVDCNNNFAPIPGTLNQTVFTPTQTGSYACTAMSGGGCMATSSCIQVTVVGLAEDRLSGISLYPSPSQGQVQLNFGELASEWWTLQVMDELGRVLMQFSGEMEGRQNLDLSKLEMGHYFLKGSSDKGSFVKRFVILY